MSDALNDRRKAAEESYFDKQNRGALERLARRAPGEVRNSPITGKPMEQQTRNGVTVDVCVDSGGIWLDPGELEALLAAGQTGQTVEAQGGTGSWLAGIFAGSKNSGTKK